MIFCLFKYFYLNFNCFTVLRTWWERFVIVCYRNLQLSTTFQEYRRIYPTGTLPRNLFSCLGMTTGFDTECVNINWLINSHIWHTTTKGGLCIYSSPYLCAQGQCNHQWERQGPPHVSKRKQDERTIISQFKDKLLSECIITCKKTAVVNSAFIQ